MKPLLTLLLLLACCVTQGQSTDTIQGYQLGKLIPIGISDNPFEIKPFETYYDTVKATLLVSEKQQVYVIEGYEVYKNEFKKGNGWHLSGDIYSCDYNEHLREIFTCLDENKKPLKKIVVWQIK